MLEKFIAFLGVLMLLIFFVAGGTVVMVGTVKHYQLQTECQVLANIMSRSGSYDNICDQSLASFCQKSNISPGDLQVEASPSDTASYGDTVEVKIKYPFKVQLSVGDMEELFDFDINTTAWATCTSIPGLNVVP